ncbi:MAG: carbohydrate ABC transporter permease [Chloroflexi bacterium]|jgi:multiple sugar transport system permease protein|nr:carbohydrate ABC transporter permease [Chloroflexota bacterium]
MIREKEIHYGLGDINWRRPWHAIRILGSYVVLVIGAAIFLLPFFWLITTSLKEQSEVYVFPPIFFPRSFHWENFPNAWNYSGMQFSRWLLNSLFITLMVLIGTLGSSILCGYGFARLSFPGRDLWFMLVLASVMLPGTVTLIPLYVGYHRIGWLDTFKPLTVPAFFGGGAFNIFLMRQFFKGIPIELEEAAIMDGSSRFRILWQIFVPLSLPAIATIAVFVFQGVWNDFYGPLIFLTSQENYTLALGINMFKGMYATEIPLMMAMSWLMVIPTLLLFFFAQRLMIRGVILTGIKA